MAGLCEQQPPVCRWLIMDFPGSSSETNAGSGGPEPGKEARPGEDNVEIFSVEKIIKVWELLSLLKQMSKEKEIT